MKKIIVVIFMVCFTAFSYGNTTVEAGIYDVYNFKASINVPHLSSDNCIRAYNNQSFVGIMTVHYSQHNVPADSITIVMSNKTTSVEHVIKINDGFINMIGKKMITPTIACTSQSVTSTEIGTHENHETIKLITFVGTGLTTNIKIANEVACGINNEANKYCRKILQFSGSVIGYMNCEYSDNFIHTIQAVSCGAGFEPAHEAAFWGNWTATRSAELSYIVK